MIRNRYEKLILPLEKEREYMAEETGQGTKIIPFPGVSLIKPEDKFQNDLDGFFREMGYIE